MDIKNALNKARHICSKREKCINDIRLKLKEWDINENNQDEIINILVDEKYIDELRYARAFVHDKLHFNKWGKIKISYHLKMKGIKESIVNRILYEINPEAYKKVLTEILQEKLNSLKNKNKAEIRQKLISFAYNRGFSFEESNEVVGRLIS